MRFNHEFLLVCESSVDPASSGGSWRFVIEHLDGTPFLEASDIEPGDSNRLSLLAVVRGLEALPGPAAVTMLTSSRYVIRSLSDSLPRWRSADFHWEHFGQMLPITNANLWRRIDHALNIHTVSACCVAPPTRVGTADGRRIVPASQQPEGSPEAAASRSDRPDRLSTVSDSLRRWLIAQCGVVAGGAQRGSGLAVA